VLYTGPNVLHCGQSRTEPQPQTNKYRNLVKFGDAVFQICEWTKRQTDRQTETPTRSSQITILHAYLERS